MNRQPLPDFIRDAPSLAPGLHLYYDAFIDLSSCRHVGMGVGPIPWGDIYGYARVLGLDDEEEFSRFLALIRAMDAEYLEWERKKVKES